MRRWSEYPPHYRDRETNNVPHSLTTLCCAAVRPQVKFPFELLSNSIMNCFCGLTRENLHWGGIKSCLYALHGQEAAQSETESSIEGARAREKDKIRNGGWNILQAVYLTKITAHKVLISTFLCFCYFCSCFLFILLSNIIIVVVWLLLLSQLK